MRKNYYLLKITYTAVGLALCIVLPLLTGQIPQIGNMLCPMHIPVLICGFLCGWQWGLGLGFVAPLLRSLLFGMPPFYPVALGMAFELAAYGGFCGLLYNIFPKRTPYVYLTLVISMTLGRAVWGIARYVLSVLSSQVFTLQLFLAGAFVNAWVGILLHIVIIPPTIIALKKAGLIPQKETSQENE